MNEWKHIVINKNLIKTETEKAVLIKMPHNSRYDGYVFWLPSKLVKNDFHSKGKRIGYTDEFTFKLKKYGSGKHNNEVISEKEIDVAAFEQAFEKVNECYSTNPYETHIPDKEEAVKCEALEELRDE